MLITFLLYNLFYFFCACLFYLLENIVLRSIGFINTGKEAHGTEKVRLPFQNNICSNSDTLQKELRSNFTPVTAAVLLAVASDSLIIIVEKSDELLTGAGKSRNWVTEVYCKWSW